MTYLFEKQKQINFILFQAILANLTSFINWQVDFIANEMVLMAIKIQRKINKKQKK